VTELMVAVRRPEIPESDSNDCISHKQQAV
jgi:hypothetical protein